MVATRSCATQGIHSTITDGGSVTQKVFATSQASYGLIPTEKTNRITYNMTGHQILHCNSIAEITATSVRMKYEDGQKEHGGDLWKKPLRREIEFELLDLICYWQTMDTQLEVICGMLIAYREGEEVPADELEGAIRLLTLKKWKT